MLNVLGRPTRLCDGSTRRQVLQAGALSALGGIGLPNVLHAAQQAKTGASAKSVVLINLLGGPSHLDMFDMKPNAPVEIRGEFHPIASTIPGLSICEHLPLTARTMHRSTLIRTHTHLYNTHSPYNLLTGYSGPVIDGNHFKPTDHPSIGAAMQLAGLRSKNAPSYVWMPAIPGHSQSKRRAGPYGGFLGRQYDPLFTTYDPKFEGDKTGRSSRADPPVPIAQPQLQALDPLPSLTVDRLDRRRSLLKQIDIGATQLANAPSARSMDSFRETAFNLLTSPHTRDAFDLSREPKSVRDRYGRNLFGSCLLTARRLVEAGSKFIGVTTESQLDGGIGAGQWDTHSNNFTLLRNFNLPTLDQYYSALIEDLHDSGLLETTLVVLMGEMGRTPKVKSNGGRDHWTQCGFIVMTGGGVKSGYVHGRSDKQAAWPQENPVSSADFVATVYQLLGIDPGMTIHDASGRPHRLAFHGEPVWDVIA